MSAGSVDPSLPALVCQGGVVAGARSLDRNLTQPHSLASLSDLRGVPDDADNRQIFR